ncbi:extracellular solute-binding protein [Sinorhizobium sp. BG8]|uniref:ABC transporter substrate-binding protein n=1 Tax=Sinorhizobium sp. BG8 TaxID=2613773 RepID=UPI00193DAE6D|nr:extracellular solute-binding protein [Sinorhizobium sp. BG8]QRM55474.1 extracellular solute-binding protein [Sinorhizobium sp. BG8]
MKAARGTMMNDFKDIISLAKKGALSRRDFGKLFAAVGVVMSTSPRGAVAADQPLFFTWATMDMPEFFGPYVAAHGTPPNFAVFGDQDEALLKVKNGFKADVVYPQSYTIKRWYDSGVLEPIDTNLISNWNDIFPNFREMPGVTIDGNVTCVPADWGLSSIAVRTDLVPEAADPANDSWALLWDSNYSGKLAALDSMADAVGAAALYKGVNAYNMSAADLETVRAALDEQRALLRFYSNDPTTLQQALTSGEIVAANTWNDTYVALKGQGIPIRYMRPKEGTMAWVGVLSIVKGTPHRELAHELIDAYLSPEARALGMTQFGYGSATKGGFEQVDDATLANLDIPRDPSALLSSTVLQGPMKDQDDIQKMFESVKQGI